MGKRKRDYEVWCDGELLAKTDSLEEAMHYSLVYAADGGAATIRGGDPAELQQWMRGIKDRLTTH